MNYRAGWLAEGRGSAIETKCKLLGFLYEPLFIFVHNNRKLNSVWTGLTSIYTISETTLEGGCSPPALSFALVFC